MSSTHQIKQEIIDVDDENTSMICVNSSSGGIKGSNFSRFFDSDSEDDDNDNDNDMRRSTLKKMKVEAALPVGFLDPLPPEERLAFNKSLEVVVRNNNEFRVSQEKVVVASTKQFWKAGDYEGIDGGFAAGHAEGMDHVRVHPKFLHSNATSHKWALGAFAELLDNAMDEVCNGATYVSVDVLDNKKEKGKMILVEDNGGGMTPDKMRQCMSLRYSAKSKLANTIGQYGNGFKTSSMRLGGDVIVFSRCQGKDGLSTTQSVGMLSYTFLRNTGKEDIIVPMIDFVKRGEIWEMLVRSSVDDWKRNSDTIVQWSPFESEEDLFLQFELLDNQGTRIIIYNLWEDEKGETELDFDTDPHDIQIKGVSRDEKKIEMAKIYPNSRHFLTYQHSLRSYASILYLRLAPGFRIILRGEDVEHHNLVDDMNHAKKNTYRPQPIGDETSKDPNAVAVVTIGFVKDAEHHIDVQGFSVYHKNRLIKPFWRVWNAAGSDGRGAIGVLEANFVKPAHDKQDFERTIVLARLEARLQFMQKQYWRDNCHEIGYADRRSVKHSVSSEDETNTSAKSNSCSRFSSNVHTNSRNVHTTSRDAHTPSRDVPTTSRDVPTTSHDKSRSKCTGGEHKTGQVHSSIQATNQTMWRELSNRPTRQISTNLGVKIQDTSSNLREEDHVTKDRLQQALRDLQYERDKNKSLEGQLKAAQRLITDLNSNHDNLAHMLLEERKRSRESSVINQELRDKVKLLGKRMPFTSVKREH
ncbi:protein MICRORCHIDIA 7-like [Solanum lycopersicum]